MSGNLRKLQPWEATNFDTFVAVRHRGSQYYTSICCKCGSDTITLDGRFLISNPGAPDIPSIKIIALDSIIREGKLIAGLPSAFSFAPTSDSRTEFDHKVNAALNSTTPPITNVIKFPERHDPLL
jgi:hypothetical protein